MMKVLLTGGAGYIGSHIYVALVEAGHDPVIIDNFSNSDPSVFKHLETLTGRPVRYFRADVRDDQELYELFELEHNIEAVIHLAGLKSVGDSSREPLEYYDVNVNGTLTLLRVMRAYRVELLIFSSSATVYGVPESCPITEDAPLSTTNPYGTTKLVVEKLLSELYASSLTGWKIEILRYFNPVGAHESGLIGESPNGTPNNLLPYISRVAAGILPSLTVHGDSYPTRDGTGERDYIHVMDLAEGHVAALNQLANKKAWHDFNNASYDEPRTAWASFQITNLGTGRGVTVLEAIKAFEAASGREVPYKIGPPRLGDVASCYADASLALERYGWKAKRSFQRACVDAWKFTERSM